MGLAGIDYGSKLAGTTAIAYIQEGVVVVSQSEKKQDADLFLREIVTQNGLDSLFIDAPLSLPKAYFGVGEDFFYRACDRELGAMSPMFLGGLTARAMKLQSSWEKEGVKCFETYPGYAAKTMELSGLGYKKEKENIPVVLSKLSEQRPDLQWPIVDNWHAFDALLALHTALRYHMGTFASVGDSTEGVIYF